MMYITFMILYEVSYTSTYTYTTDSCIRSFKSTRASAYTDNSNNNGRHDPHSPAFGVIRLLPLSPLPAAYGICAGKSRRLVGSEDNNNVFMT